jgi:ABC-type branched-subunit amino acid transport system substrate-binding protein
VAGQIPRPTSTPIVFHFLPASVTPKPSATPLPTLTPSATATRGPDLSGQEISLVFLCDRSGPLAAANAGRVAGVEDMVAAINASGGIFGAALDLHSADTLGSIDGAQRAEARLMRQFADTPLVLICDPLTEGALLATLDEDRVPALGPGVFAEPGGFLYGLDASPAQHLAFWLEDLAAHWANRKPDGSGDEIRLAILSWPAEQAGEAATPEVLTFAQSLGVQIVLQTELPADEPIDIFDFIYAAREQNANVIFTNARSSGLAALLNGLSDLGLRERFVVGAPAAVYDNDLYTYLADPAFAQGLYLTSAWAWWSDADTGGVQFAKDLLAGSSFKPAWAHWGYLQMVGAIDLARQVLENAILTNGFERLDRAAVASALDSYAALGGVFPVDYSAGARSLNQLAVWRVGAVPGDLSVVSSLSAVPTLIP